MKKIQSVVFLLVVFSLLASHNTYARDILSQIHPYITVKEEYNDNLYLTKENKKRDFITTITPGIRFDNMDAKSGIILDVNGGPVFYYDHSNLNYITANALLDAKYLTTSHWNFYLREAFTRSDSPREREYYTTIADNKYVLATETTMPVHLLSTGSIGNTASLPVMNLRMDILKIHRISTVIGPTGHTCTVSHQKQWPL